jgi:hypothetical protein
MTGSAGGPAGSIKLKPSTEAALIEQLDWMKQNDTRALDRYFPAVSSSGEVTYATVDQLTHEQADVLRFQLQRAIRYTIRQEGRRMAREVSLSPLRSSLAGRTTELAEEDDIGGHERIKRRMLESALVDLCSSFGLPNPLA